MIYWEIVYMISTLGQGKKWDPMDIRRSGIHSEFHCTGENTVSVLWEWNVTSLFFADIVYYKLGFHYWAEMGHQTPNCGHQDAPINRDFYYWFMIIFNQMFNEMQDNYSTWNWALRYAWLDFMVFKRQTFSNAFLEVPC